MANHEWLLKYIDSYSDFPQNGVIFQWYGRLLKDPKAFRKVIKIFAEHYKKIPLDAIAGVDARGFIFGAAVAYELSLPFVLVRKAGKLPGTVEKLDYALEYGKNSFEIEADSIKPNDRVLLVDDVLGTGGSVAAAIQLIERLGGNVVEVACLIEIKALQGRKKIKPVIYSLLTVEGT